MHDARYCPSGIIAWPKFLPGAMLALASAIGFGTLLGIVHVWSDGPPLAQFPIAFSLAMPTGYLLRRAIRAGKCRSPHAALLLGIASAVAYYLTAFHAQLVGQMGIGHVHRVDWLPGFLWSQMTGFELQVFGRRLPATVTVLLHLVEFVTIALVTTLPAWFGATDPFCEHCRKWMATESIIWPAGTGRRLVESMNSGSLVEFAADPPAPGRPAFPSSPTSGCCSWTPSYPAFISRGCASAGCCLPRTSSIAASNRWTSRLRPRILQRPSSSRYAWLEASANSHLSLCRVARD